MALLHRRRAADGLVQQRHERVHVHGRVGYIVV